MTKPRNDQRDRSMPLMPWPSFTTGASLQAAGPNVASMAELNGKCILGWMTLQRQWTGFLMHRIQEEVALAHRLTRCSGPQDMYAVYADFYQQAFAAYQREFGELMRLGQTTLTETTSAAQMTIESVTQETPRVAA